MSRTAVYLDDRVKEALEHVCSTIEPLFSVDDFTTLVEVSDGLMLHTRLQAIFNIKHSQRLSRTLHELIVTHALDAERTAPLSFDPCIHTVVSSILNTGWKDRELGDVFPARSRDIENVIERCTHGDVTVCEMLRRAINIAGFNGKIIVERALNAPHVELRAGYTFAVKSMFVPPKTLKNTKIVCIDGIVENVSEIHHFLEQASESREACAVFVRGASDDVTHTLKVNLDRGTLRVVMFVVPFDLDGANTLVDIAIASGCDVTSSLKGELISSIDLKDAPTVSRVDATTNSVTLHNIDTLRRVRAHVDALRKKRDNIDQEVLQNLINNRIRSLSSGYAVIRLDDDHKYVWRAQAIDYTLRSIQSMISHGVDVDSFPAASHLVSRTYADKCLVTLRDLACVITPT